METTKYIGKVLPNGQVSIPLDLFVEFGLSAGEEIEVTLKKLDSNRDVKVIDASFNSISGKKQRRLSALLYKNREGQLTDLELLELEKLIFETQIKTMEKARALFEQKNRKTGLTT